MTTKPPGNTAWTDALHIFVLCGFAFAQPLFDILSRIDAFYLFLRATPLNVLFLVFTFSFLIPALGVGIELAGGLWSLRLRRNLHGLLVAALVTLIVLPALKHVGNIPPVTTATMAAVVGVAGCLSYLRFAPVRTFLTVLSPSILVFPLLFLSSSYVSKLVFLKGDSAVAVSKVDANAPVVFVIFDELPVTSLMDESRTIDSSLYPHFAALAEHATWYRNATTVSDYTMFAVPAILSGKYPLDSSVPTIADYPHNLFTLLGGTYDLHVFETHSYLCPRSLCKNRMGPVKMKRIWGLVRPVSLLYLEIVLPPGMNRSLLKILRSRSGASSKLKGPEGARPPPQTEDRLKAFEKLVESIAYGKRPALYSAYINLPHFPWEYLPSGKRYPQRGFLGGKGGMQWGADEDAILRDYQRHLLQVGFVDTLLGRLLTRLESVGLYDQALIIVTADHGISFRANDRMRDITATNYQDILPVPLLIKAPYQDQSLISDRNLETVDILPTLADLLKIRLPWDVDGRSAVDPVFPERWTKPTLGSITYTPDRKYAALDRKLRIFGSGQGIDRLFKIGPHAGLIGRSTGEIGFTRDSDRRVEIETEDRLVVLDQEAAIIPAMITGRVKSRSGGVDTLDVAVALNGTVQAVANVVAQDAGEGEFSVMVPETAFRAGENVVDAFVVERGGGQLRLARTSARDRASTP